VVALLLAAGCRDGGDGAIEARVREVAIDPASGSPVVLLEDPKRRVALPIWIGPAEAQAIAAHLDGATPPRPMTHDLMKTALERLQVGLRRVVIRELRDHTYFADIVLDHAGEEVVVDSRPSDAIALAVRFGQPILVDRQLFLREAVVDLRRASGDSLMVAGLTIQLLSADLAAYFELPVGRGVVVADIAADGPAGVQRGDVILAVDGDVVRTPSDFRDKMRAAGEHAVLSVHRDGARIEVDLELRPPGG
jgi:bifunctional DNase/RNase